MIDIDPEFLNDLRCPRCRSAIRIDGDRLVCQAADCGLRFPVRDGILVMLESEAERPARPDPAPKA